ncbi:MAG: copper transporter [Solirubrobacteraceae bacterium]
MFDFRYHALSLVAVFLALAVGLLLGVAIGDSGLVSSAQKDIENSLRGDVRASRAEADEVRGELTRHVDYEKQTYPDLVAGRLPGARIGLLFLGSTEGGVVDQVREAIEPAGGDLRWVGVLREPPDLQALADHAVGSRYVTLADNPALLEPLVERLGQQLAVGGRMVSQQRSALMSSFSGEIGQLDGIVIARSPSRPEETDDQHGTTDALEGALVRGLLRDDRPVLIVVRGVDHPPRCARLRPTSACGRSSSASTAAPRPGGFGGHDRRRHGLGLRETLRCGASSSCTCGRRAPGRARPSRPAARTQDRPGPRHQRTSC